MADKTANDAVGNSINQILHELKRLNESQAELSRRLDVLESSKLDVQTCATSANGGKNSKYLVYPMVGSVGSASTPERFQSKSFDKKSPIQNSSNVDGQSKSSRNLNASIYNRRIILATYPGQFGVKPVPVHWGSPNPVERGPIIASRNPGSLKLRNAVGAHGGSYGIYRALAVASGELDPNYIPNFKNTAPPVSIGPYQSWGDPTKIVSMDPWGHIVVDTFKAQLEKGYDIRPTIAITKAHMRVPEIEASVKSGSLKVDNKFVLPGGDIVVTKAAIEPVWYLPGVASRFNVDEVTLRRALFEDTGGMYSELITRPDLKVFLPPIGGSTAYIFGDPSHLADPNKKVTVRVHDECNGSDVFGSDICTCRPYLMFGIEECVRAAQDGQVGVIVYFRKEGRALGEVTKYLVYNARKRAEEGDTAKAYFKRTEFVAGVRDMRFQALMPDVLHWLGITKIHRLLSMSNHKYDAITQSGIVVENRVEIPECMIPEDSRVEIDAKIASGYFANKKVTDTDLANTKGRTWEDINH